MSKDGRRAIESFRSIASLLVTSPAFRQLASDFILVSRDIFADAASAAADTAKDAAEKSRPSEKERKEGVDLDKVQQKGKQVAKDAQSKRKQRQVKDDLWSEIEAVREYVEDKLPEGEEARDKAVERLQAIITQAQSNDEYKRSISTLVGLVKKYAHKAEEALDETTKNSAVNDEDEKIQQAGRDLKAFVEKVSNKSVDDLIDAGQKVCIAYNCETPLTVLGRPRRSGQREAVCVLRRTGKLRSPLAVRPRLRCISGRLPQGVSDVR